MLFTLFFFFFNDTATTEIYTLSLHDALPIYRGADRLGEDVRGVPRRDRFAGAPGARGSPPGRDAGGLHLAPQSAVERRPEEPGRAARRDLPHAGAAVPARRRDPHACADRRHAGRRAAGDGEAPPAHSRHDAREPVSPAYGRALARDAAHGAHRDRGRDPRRGARQAGEPPRPLARAPGPPRRAPAAAHRALGYTKANRGNRPLPHRQRPTPYDRQGVL